MNVPVQVRHRFELDDHGCSFTVFGIPQSGGSKKGSARLGRIVIRDDNDNAAPWKEEVAKVGRALMRHRQPWKQALAVEVTFFRKRPRSHFNGNGTVRPGAPWFPTTRPDATKLMRPFEDALTGIVWADDAIIVDQVVRKRFCVNGDEPRAEIVVRTVWE